MTPDNKQPEENRLPPLRKGITCTFSEYDVHGRPHWMINDAGRNKFFLIGWAEHQIYEHWHLGDPNKIIDAINDKTTLNVDMTDIENFLTFLKNNYLLKQSGYDIHNMGKEQKIFDKDNWFKWLVHHYLFFRIPLWHPDRFLVRTKKIGAIIFSRAILYTMIVLAFIAVYQISTQWDTFKHTFTTLFSWDGLIYYFIAFTICKFFHEMGHAYMCRRYDVPVQSLGVAFLVFWPVLYTDTTLSWSLKSHQRMRIALAGIWVETYVIIIAALIWCNTDNLAIKTVCYMTITINWIGSLLINASPFMRFDGYYVLADYLRMPNLQPRAFALTRWQIRRWLFDWPEPAPEKYATHLHRFLIAYSITTWIYRLVLYIGIAVLVYHFFIKILGIILFIIEVYYFILAPILNEIKYLKFQKDKLTWNKRTKTSAIVFGIFVLLFFLPIRNTITIPGTLSYVHGFIVAQEEGMIARPLPPIGAKVKKNEIVVELQSPDLENALRTVVLNYKQKLAELRNAKINLTNFNEKNIILSDINKSEAEYNKLYALYEKLTIRAPFDGTVYEIAPNLHPGVYVMKNEWIADIVDTSKTLIEAFVDEKDLYLIKKGLKGYFYPDHFSQSKIPVKVLQIDALNTADLTCEYSKPIKQNKDQSTVVDTPCYNASDFGGEIPTYLADDGKLVPAKSVYRVKLETDHTANVTYVERGNVVLTTSAHSFASGVFYWFKDLLVKQTGF